MKIRVGVDIACRSPHVAAIADEAGNILSTWHRFRTIAAELSTFWALVPADATEVLVVPKRSVVELVYALTGVGLLAACAHPDVRGYSRLGRKATPGVSEMASSR